MTLSSLCCHCVTSSRHPSPSLPPPMITYCTLGLSKQACYWLKLCCNASARETHRILLKSVGTPLKNPFNQKMAWWFSSRYTVPGSSVIASIFLVAVLFLAVRGHCPVPGGVVVTTLFLLVLWSLPFSCLCSGSLLCSCGFCGRFFVLCGLVGTAPFLAVLW